jgi:hypothetical protein
MPNRLTQKEFIQRAILKHEGYYDYSLAEYKDMYSLITIVCPIHGSFKQKPVKHLLGQGCKKCRLEKRNQSFRNDLSDFIQRAKQTHGDVYDYSKVVYINNRTPVEIVCLDHGSFWQRPDCHYRRGHGCPQCQDSHGERLIKHWLESKGLKFIPQYKFVDCKDQRSLPFDFYLPEHNTCIEYDGVQHSNQEKVRWKAFDTSKIKKHDSIKNYYCQNKGIQLIRISYKAHTKRAVNLILSSYLPD